MILALPASLPARRTRQGCAFRPTFGFHTTVCFGRHADETGRSAVAIDPERTSPCYPEPRLEDELSSSRRKTKILAPIFLKEFSDMTEAFNNHLSHVWIDLILVNFDPS